MSGEVLNLADAERAKANGLALRQLVRARQEAGALVEVELAERILFEQGQKFRNAWMNWPVRVAPEIAAELDVDVEALTRALTNHVHEQLARLGEPTADFSG